MKITVLTYLEKEGDEKLDGVVEQVAEALRASGHTVSILGVHGDVRKLILGIARKKPDLIFNLMEMFGDNLCGDVAVAGLLDLLRIPHTGGGPGEYYLQQDKALAKRLLAYEGIRYPKYAVLTKQDQTLEKAAKLQMPLFVKPLRGDASLGIEVKSLVRDQRELQRRVTSIHDKFNDSAIVEEYIEGREFYVGILGNGSPVALPAIEMDFTALPAGEPRFLDRKAKFASRSLRYKGTKAVLAQIPEELSARLAAVSLQAYRAVRVRDYGRVDLRLTDGGDLYVIEVNASCYLEKESEFATAAQAAGIDFRALVGRIVELALERHKAVGTPVMAGSSRDERGSSPTP
ncbi:MAG TPA: ATP-grasp domain-containing protein [Polyangia bacterium]|jgi:D-alanine-D-alanine ligase